MSLLSLPPELRIQILSHLPDHAAFSPSRTETVGPNIRLTPPISRVNRTLRRESLPLFAKHAAFIIQTDDDLQAPNGRLKIWLDAFGGEPLSKVQSLQLSRHWKIRQPARWQGHVGFYVRLQLYDRHWQCTVGTYPIANDIRGMRLESVELLGRIVSRRLERISSTNGKGLKVEDVWFVVSAMEVVASHPISTFDTEQSELGRQRRREGWCTMEAKLWALDEGTASASKSSKAFFTPY